jgi:subtilase family serine protease
LAFGETRSWLGSFDLKLLVTQDELMRSNTLCRIFFVLSAFLVTLGGIGVATALGQSQIPSRINAVVSNASTTAIAGSIHYRVSQATDLGAAPGDTKLIGMTLRFTPSAAQQAALEQLLADQQNPASPRFHQWLTPQQFAAQFGLSSADLAKVTAWLAREGFTVTGVAQGGSFVTFDGTVDQAQKAFSTSIHSISVNGEAHFANVTDVSVPSAFADVVGSVTGLHDFRLKPRIHASVATSSATPKFTTTAGAHWIAPGDLYTIYDSAPLITAGTWGGGVAIAVTGQVQISLTDASSFRSSIGLSTTNLPTLVPVGGGASVSNGCNPDTTSNCASPNMGDLQESSLDVQWAGAMAPAANILFVNASNALPGGTGLDAMSYAIDNNLAPIVTTSYGLCEVGWGTSLLNSMNSLFEQANAQGQTVIAAAGDAGSLDCYGVKGLTTALQEGLAVDFPGSSPYVTSMGGTEFNEGNATGATQYWNTNDTSSDYGGSALSYIPEAAWNDEAFNSFGGGGGGVSAYFSKPSWQVETGASGMTTTVPSTLMTMRGVPDIALDASDEHDVYFFCMTTSGESCPNYVYLAGGTSFDAQIFGGMLALIEQKTGTRLGNINPALYTLGNNATYYNIGTTSVFHDITVGNNELPSTINGLIGYAAGTGYDLATGWGSVDLNNLANAASILAPTVSGFKLSTSATAVSGVPTVTVASGGTVPGVTITVTPVAGFTGTVAFTGQVYGSGSPTISFSPQTVTISSTASASTTLTLTGAVANLHQPNAPGGINGAPSLAGVKFAAGSGVTIASLLLIMLPRKRRLGGLLMVALACALVVGASGCGGSSQAVASGSSSSSAGTYLVTITGSNSSGAILQSTSVTFQLN